MKIGVDLDGVVVDTYSRVIQYYNNKLEKYATLSDFPSSTKVAGFLHEFCGLDVDHAKEMWFGDMNVIFQSAPPVEGVIDSLNFLSEKGFELFYISARPDRPGVKETTAKWLQYYDIPFYNNLIINQSSKVQTSTDLEIDYFIEDAPHHIDMLQQGGIKVICLKTPYNQMVKVNELISIRNSWKETQAYLLENTKVTV